MAVKFLNGIDVEGSMNLHSSDIPNLDASKITSGTLSPSRIPDLSGAYQVAGDYLTLETANTTFQPLGNYLTSVPAEYLTQTEGDTRYINASGSDSKTGTLTINEGNLRIIQDVGNVAYIDLGEDPSGHVRLEYDGTGSGATNYFYIYSPLEGWATKGSSLNIQPSTGKVAIGTTTFTEKFNVEGNVRFTGTISASGYNKTNWDTAYGWGNHASAGYLTSLPSHNHDTLYDAIGSADAVGQQVNERIDTEVFDAINSKQAAGNYFTDGDTVLNMANNDGLVYNDTNNLMYIKADGTNYPIIDSRGGTVTGSINMTGGGTKLSMNNGDIVGVNQLKINDPGEGIVWNNGSSGDITLAVVDDSSDNRLNLAGTNASLSINNATVATQSWVSGQGYLTSLPSHNHDTLYDSLGSAAAVNARIDEEVFPALDDLGNAIPTNNNQLTNGAGYITSADGGNAATLDGIDSTGFVKQLSNTNSPNYFTPSSRRVDPNTTNPTNEHYAVSTFGNNGNVTGQIATHFQTGKLYSRGYNSSWSAWNAYATEAYVNTAVSNLVDSAPGALNTLNELAAALGDDANFSTTVTNNIAAVDARINDEVFPALGDIQTAVDGKLDATAKAADSNLLDGLNSTSFLRSDANDTKTGDTTFTGKVTLQTNLVITEDAPTISFLDTTSGADDFYIHVNSNNFYVLRDTAGSNTVDGGWDSPHPLQLEGDTNKAFVFGNQIKSAAYQNTSAFDSAGSASTAQANAIAHADNRIDSEIQPAIDTIGDLASTAHGWGNHASAGYLTSLPNNAATFTNNIYLNNSTTTADFITELTNLGAFQDNYKAFKVAWSYAGNSNLNVGFETIELAGCLIECWGGTYKHVRVTRPTTGAGGRSIYVYNDQGSNYAPGWRQIWTSDEFSNTNLSNWNTAYGWGNHASAGYLTSIPSGYVQQGQDIVSGNIHPVGDREQLLGLDSNRWQIVFCEILDSAGQHEKNLQNPAGETSVADYATGTVMVWENGKNVPCTTYANHMRMGIAVENVDSPMIQGAEPVLVTGSVSEGDYLVTSTTTGHAVAVSRDTVKQEQLWDCVIGKALEGGEGESHLIKTWVTI